MRANVDSMLQSVLGGWAGSFGMAAVVLRGDCIVAQGVAGVRREGAADCITLNGASSPRPSPPSNGGEGNAITLEDRFHIGSCGKAMTATLAAVLVEEGRLSWTDTVGRIFTGAMKDIPGLGEDYDVAAPGALRGLALRT